MSEILNQFRDEELPPSIVDAWRAVRAGRRRRRIRTGLAAGGVALALAVAGAAAPTLLSALPGPPPPAAPQCGSPEPARPSLPTWQRFDPLTLEIDASGVPGYHLRLSASSTNWQTVLLEREGADPDTPGAGAVYVTLYACEGEPRAYDPAAGELLPFDPGAGEPAGPIGGAPAYWLPSNGVLPGGAPSGGLAWQWSSGAWVVVYAEPDPETAPVAREVLRSAAAEVAPHLELGVGTAVTSPFSLPRPDGTYPSVTATNWAGDAGELFAVGFSIGFDRLGQAAPAQPIADGYVPSLAVDATTFTSPDDRPDGATEYPEDLGYPAFQAVLPFGDRDIDVLLVYDVLGFGLRIQPVEAPGASTRAERLSLAADVFRTITVYPGAADGQENWGDPIAP